MLSTYRVGVQGTIGENGLEFVQVQVGVGRWCTGRWGEGGAGEGPGWRGKFNNANLNGWRKVMEKVVG